MDRRLEEVTSQSLQRVADVDRDGLVLRLDPLPLLLRVQNLQSGDGLVVFALDVVLVVFDELVFVGQLEDDGEEAEELDDYLAVAFSAEGFNLFDVVLQDGGLCALVVAVELGEVVHLHVVFDGFGESGGVS